MNKVDKLKKQKEEYLELRNELLEKGYTTDEIAEYLYYSDIYHEENASRDLGSLALVLGGGISLALCALSSMLYNVNNGSITALAGITTMSGIVKFIMDPLFLNKKIPSYILMKNIEEKVEMREVNRTNTSLEQKLRTLLEEYENSENIIKK